MLLHFYSCGRHRNWVPLKRRMATLGGLSSLGCADISVMQQVGHVPGWSNVSLSEVLCVCSNT
jgi:hypothetical protein